MMGHKKRHCMMKIETVFHENKAILNVYVPNKRAFVEEGHSNPLQYSCLEKPMDREAGGL